MLDLAQRRIGPAEGADVVGQLGQMSGTGLRGAQEGGVLHVGNVAVAVLTGRFPHGNGAVQVPRRRLRSRTRWGVRRRGSGIVPASWVLSSRSGARRCASTSTRKC